MIESYKRFVLLLLLVSISNARLLSDAKDTHLDEEGRSINDSNQKPLIFSKKVPPLLWDLSPKKQHSCKRNFPQNSSIAYLKKHKSSTCERGGLNHRIYLKERLHIQKDNTNIPFQTSLDEAHKLANYDIQQGIQEFEHIYTKYHSTSALFSVGKLSNKVAKGFLEDMAKHKDDEFKRKELAENIKKWQQKSVDSMCKILKIENESKLLSLQAGIFCLELAMKMNLENQTVQALTLLHKKYPKKSNYGYQLALKLLLRLDLEGCESVLRDVINMHRDRPNSREKCLLGLCLKLRNKNDVELRHSNENEDELNKMIQLASDEDEEDSLRLFNLIGTTFNRNGKHRQAELIFDEGVRIGLFLSKWQRSSSRKDFRLKHLRGIPIWKPNETGYQDALEKLQKQYRVIRSEGLKALFGNDKNYKEESENLREEGLWQQLVLFETGVRSEQGCKLAPKTCSLIMKYMKEISAECKHGQVKFSVIHPETHIWPHSGPSNCRLRAHLGLVVPEVTNEDRLEIRIADKYAHWEEGKFLIIDDSFEHEIWYQNKNGGERLVLLIDMWHPDLTQSQKETISPLINRNQNHSTIFTVSGIVNKISDNEYYNINDIGSP